MKKLIIAIIVLFILVFGGIVAFVLLSPTTYEVSFDTNGGTKISSIKVQENERINLPEPPTREGYIFKGWYCDGEEVTEGKRVRENLELEAVWEKIVDESDEEIKEDEPSKKMVKIPNVSGKSIKDATSILKKAGLSVSSESIEESSEKIKAGQVIGTKPKVGTELEYGSSITLYVSTGSEEVVIESYVGKNYLDVKAKLESRGLIVIVEKSSNSTYQNGYIIKQSIAKGTKVKKGTSITLIIADNGDVYPDFVKGKYTVEQVQKYCSDHEIQLIIEYVEGTGEKSGTIISQSRPSGYKVTSGTSLKIKVAK